MAFHETIAVDEDSRFTGFAQELVAMSAARALRATNPTKPTSRALHAKQHVGVSAHVDVIGGGEGMFATAARYGAYVRFSNGAGASRSDKTPDARGLAVKIVGVEGRKIIPGLEDKKTQDFLFITTPSLPFKSPDEFMSFVRAAGGGPALLVPRLLLSLGIGRGLSVIQRLAKSPKLTSYATHPFYTAAPIAWGQTAAKLSLVPVGEESRVHEIIPPADEAGAFRSDLITRLQNGPLTWSLRAQTFVDDDVTPIEDASVTWPEDRSPYLEMATLTIDKQDAESMEGRALSHAVDAMSFDPWHATEAHRPLGAVMRARAVAYRESVMARGASAEPES